MAKVTIDSSTTTTISGIAAILGVTSTWIRALREKGVISSDGREFNVSETIQAYIKDLKRKHQEELDAANEGRSEDEESMEQLTREKMRADRDLKRARADMARLELDEVQGTMHRSEDVAMMTEDLIYSIRHALTALPGRCALDTAEAKTAAETAVIIKREVHEVMKELADYGYDPRLYQERVRERQKKEQAKSDEDDD